MDKNKETNVTDVQIFKTPQFGEIRTVIGANHEPLFIANDVCKALGYLKPRNAVKQHVDSEDALKQGVLTNGGTQEMLLINESGVYALIFGSDLPTAKQFKKLVTSEILPSIRKSGGYMATKADETPEDIMARALVLANETINRRNRELENAVQRNQMLEGEKQLLETENRSLAPKAEYTDRVLQSANTYTTTQIAKELGMSAVALEKRLHDKGVIFKQSGQWMPYQKYAGKGYTKTRTHFFTRSDGSTGSNTITVWTEYGRAFVHNIINPLRVDATGSRNVAAMNEVCETILN